MGQAETTCRFLRKILFFFQQQRDNYSSNDQRKEISLLSVGPCPAMMKLILLCFKLGVITPPETCYCLTWHILFRVLLVVGVVPDPPYWRIIRRSVALHEKGLCGVFFLFFFFFSVSVSLSPPPSLPLPPPLSLSLSLSPKLRTFSKCKKLAYRRKNSGLGPEYRFLSSILCVEIGQLAARVTVLFS